VDAAQGSDSLTLLATPVWPEDDAPPGIWHGGGIAMSGGGPFNLGLTVGNVPVLVQGLKFVPLGPDMPPPPMNRKGGR
jgi:hypothetical protein